MKVINALGQLVIDALKSHGCAISDIHESKGQFRFKQAFKTRGGDVHQQVRLYPDKVQFEDLYHFDNNVLAGGHNTLPLEFMPIYNTILSIYVKETGSIPETDFILY
jgi:hypothetical protein